MVIAAEAALDINQTVTLLIAAYAALVSTGVLVWDIYKSRSKIQLKAWMGYVITGNPYPDNRYICVTADNNGDRPATITNLSGLHYDCGWNAYFGKNKPKNAFVFHDLTAGQPIPYRLEIGDQWMGLPRQDADLEKWAKEGYLFIILSTGQKNYRIRVKHH